MSRPRVLLGDDHYLLTEGLKNILDQQFDVVATVANGRDLVAEAQRLLPDIILIDISMPILNGIEAARQISKLKLGSKIVFVTQRSDREYVQTALCEVAP